MDSVSALGGANCLAPVVETTNNLPDNIDLSIQCLHDNMDSDKDLDHMLN